MLALQETMRLTFLSLSLYLSISLTLIVAHNAKKAASLANYLLPYTGQYTFCSLKF